MLELSQFDSAKDHKISYALAVLLFVSLLTFLLIPIHYFKYKQDGTIKTKYLSEIYDGFKDNTASKLFIFIFLLKRFLMACVIVFMRNVNIWARVILFALIQITVLIYSIIVRPFKKVKENLIEILNEVTFTLLCLVIVVCNDESRWFNDLDNILIFFLMSVGVLIGIIIGVDLIIGCIRGCRK